MSTLRQRAGLHGTSGEECAVRCHCCQGHCYLKVVMALWKRSTVRVKALINEVATTHSASSQIEHLRAGGGSAIVYRAVDRHLQRDVALKARQTLAYSA